MRRTRFRFPRTSARSRDATGASLLEVVVTVSLLLVVCVPLFAALTSTQRSEEFVRGRAAALDDLRVTMDRLTRDVRQGSTVVGTPTANLLALNTYVRGVPHVVTYTASGTTLTRAVDGATPVVVERGIASTAVFQYAPDDVSPEVVTITLAVKPANLPDTVVTLDSEVQLRNLAGDQ
jgi:Tfp pilus assembly protein PilW